MVSAPLFVVKALIVFSVAHSLEDTSVLGLLRTRANVRTSDASIALHVSIAAIVKLAIPNASIAHSKRLQVVEH